MGDLLAQPNHEAAMRQIAERLAMAAARVSPSSDEAMPAQISRRELLQHPTAESSETAVALQEPEPDPELHRLGRYIAWRFQGAADAFRGRAQDGSTRPGSFLGERSDPPPPELRSAESLYNGLEPLEWAPDRWPALDGETLARLAFQRLVKFAHQGMSVDPSLAGMYPFLVNRLSEARRLQLLADVGFNIETDRSHVGVLLPFLYNDPSLVVTSYAAFLWAQREPVASDDGMDGVRSAFSLATMLMRAEIERPQAILAGLLALGDGRALSALDKCWRPFPENQKTS